MINLTIVKFSETSSCYGVQRLYFHRYLLEFYVSTLQSQLLLALKT